jgi:hypothetical protein
VGDPDASDLAVGTTAVPRGSMDGLQVLSVLVHLGSDAEVGSADYPLARLSQSSEMTVGVLEVEGD